MSHDENVPLGKVASVISGYAFKSSEFGDSGVPVIKIANIRVGSIDLSDCAKVPEQYIERIHKKYLVNAGDILISLTGSHITQPNSVVGRVARMPEYASKHLLNQRAGKIIISDKNICDEGYLYHHLALSSKNGDIAVMASGAANQANVSPTQIQSLLLRLPPPPTQRRIASILSAYDDLIENNTRRIAILEEMARRLYEEWFVNFHFPGYETAHFVKTELGPVPEGWEVVALENIADEVRDAVNPVQVAPDTSYVGLEHIPRRSITLCEWGTAETVNSSKLIFKKRDILFGKIRPYFHKVVTAPIDGICSTDTILIRPKQRLFYAVVLCTVSSDAFVSHAVQTSNGTKMPRADWKVLKKYQVAHPKNGILERFNEIIVDAVEHTQNLMFKNANLRAQRDLLLPKLISGELDVSEAEELVEEAAV